MVDLIELPIETEDYNFFVKHFPNFVVEGLVFLNPRRWPAFVAGSSAASEMEEFGDKIQIPFHNLGVAIAKEYLETAKK